MDLFQIVLITFLIGAALSRRHSSSSDESIEHLLYYKDCQRKPKQKEAPKPQPMPLRAPAEPLPQPFECRNPKMCCSLSCNNECGNGPPSMFNQLMSNQPMNNQPMSIQPSFPQRQQQIPIQSPIGPKGRKKKGKPPILPPIGARREFGFTKERIKSLIAKDDDIRKILKDLVRVTMQKVDLVEMIHSRRNAPVTEDTKKLEMSNSGDDDDLE